MNKKIIYLIIVIMAVIFSSCSNSNDDNIIDENINNSDNQDELTNESKGIGLINDLEEQIQLINFNSNLNEFESKWLKTLEEKYPNSKIFHIKTKLINCEDCYEVYYKRDRTIIKVKVLNGDAKITTTVSDLKVDIENTEVCSLFGGEWNECPKVCDTDEEACATLCGNPICEFDEDKIIKNELGEVCGDVNYGDCVFGLSCYFENMSDKSGICRE